MYKLIMFLIICTVFNKITPFSKPYIYSDCMKRSNSEEEKKTPDSNRVFNIHKKEDLYTTEGWNEMLEFIDVIDGARERNTHNQQSNPIESIRQTLASNDLTSNPNERIEINDPLRPIAQELRDYSIDVPNMLAELGELRDLVTNLMSLDNNNMEQLISMHGNATNAIRFVSGMVQDVVDKSSALNQNVEGILHKLDDFKKQMCELGDLVTNEPAPTSSWLFYGLVGLTILGGIGLIYLGFRNYNNMNFILQDQITQNRNINNNIEQINNRLNTPHNHNTNHRNINAYLLNNFSWFGLGSSLMWLIRRR